MNRVPPTGNEALPASVKKTRAVIHQDANWQNIKLVLDMLREGVTSTGDSIGELGNLYEQIGLAVDDPLRHQWALNAPWWQTIVDGVDNDAAKTKLFHEIRQATFDYMKAYNDTGLLDQDRRLTQTPLPDLGRRVADGLTVLYTFKEGDGDSVEDVSGIGTPLTLHIKKPESVSWLPGGGLAVHDDVLIATTSGECRLNHSSVDACCSFSSPSPF